MREIKFRAWEEEVQEMFYEVGVINGSYFVSFDGKGYDEVGNYKALRIMQYTGLKDKNGVEIYEGDILRIEAKGYESIVSEVVWGGADYPAFDLPKCDGYGANAFSAIQHSDAQDTMEVIGNIYENPELLKD